MEFKMRYFLSSAVIVLCVSALDVEMADVKCSSTELLFKNTIKACDFNQSVAITERNVIINEPKDEIMGLIRFSKAKLVEYLPIHVADAFPQLYAYYARECSIREIRKENFEGLKKLEILELGNNLIEIVRSDTFQGLIGLRSIGIVGNNIRAINGHVFDNLPTLMVVELASNECISMSFNAYNASDKAYMAKFISERCGFHELEAATSVKICENIRADSISQPDSCRANDSTVVNSDDMTIADPQSNFIENLNFEGNKKIEFLPISTSLKFPRLAFYFASDCSIRNVSKKHFERLDRLRILNLRRNFIETLKSDTFRGLTNLVTIFLSGNRIKHMNGRLFEDLPALRYVELDGNVCIDQIFAFETEIPTVSRAVTEKCAFNEEGGPGFKKVFDLNCGVVPGGAGLIIGGDQIKRGQWPFMAALLYEVGDTQLFFCGGNIITARHVLTAAHCMHPKYENRMEAEKMAVLLGRHNLKLIGERDSEIRSVLKFFIHPDWKHDVQKYDADLAILELDEEVKFSNFIQPICLTGDPDLMTYEDGYVVGWGKSEDPSRIHENIPKQVLLRAVNDSICFSKDHKLGLIYSDRMFCGGGAGSGPCQGDSGGGFFVKYHGLWTLRGTVSSAALNDLGCDVNRYALYSKVIDFADWIQATVERSLVNATENKITSTSESITSTVKPGKQKYFPRTSYT